VAVVVFDSADPDFFLAHYDIAADHPPSTRCRRRPPLPPLGGLPHPAGQVSGGDDHRSAGQGLAVRAASSPSPPTSASPVGSGPCWGSSRSGSPPCRGRALDPLPGIVGRGRAFEILLGGEDFDGELASGTDTSTAPFPTRSSSGSSMPLRSGCRVSTRSRWPTSSASSCCVASRRRRADC